MQWCFSFLWLNSGLLTEIFWVFLASHSLPMSLWFALLQIWAKGQMPGEFLQLLLKLLQISLPLYSTLLLPCLSNFKSADFPLTVSICLFLKGAGPCTLYWVGQKGDSWSLWKQCSHNFVWYPLSAEKDPYLYISIAFVDIANVCLIKV